MAIHMATYYNPSAAGKHPPLIPPPPRHTNLVWALKAHGRHAYTPPPGFGTHIANTNLPTPTGCRPIVPPLIHQKHHPHKTIALNTR